MKPAHHPTPCAEHIKCFSCQKSGHVAPMCYTSHEHVQQREMDDSKRRHSHTISTNLTLVQQKKKTCSRCSSTTKKQYSTKSQAAQSVTCASVSASHVTGVNMLPFLSMDVNRLDGTTQKVDTLLDMGSQSSFVSRKTARNFNFSVVGHRTLAFNTMSGEHPECLYPIVRIPVSKPNKETIFIYAVVVDAIPQQTYPEEIFPILSNLHKRNQDTKDHLAYQHMNRNNVNCEILLGIDHYYQIVQGDKPVTFQRGISLLDTIYGKVPVGRIPELDYTVATNSAVTSGCVSLVYRN